MEWSERRLSDIAENFGWVSSAETKACELHQALISTHRMVAPPAPFLCCLVTLPRDEWSALGYDETDRVSLVRHLGSLGCRAADEKGVTALHYLFRYGWTAYPEMVQALVDIGCNVNARDLDGETVLHVAGRDSATADPTEASAERLSKLLDVLIRAGAEVKSFDDSDWNILFYLMESQDFSRNYDLLKRFVDMGVQANTKDVYGCSLIHQAAQFQQPLTVDLFRYLVQQGCDVNARDEDGQSALHVAASYQSPMEQDLLEAFAEAGADLAACDDNGRDALYYLACGMQEFREEVAHRLLDAGCRADRGADPRGADPNGMTQEQADRYDLMVSSHANRRAMR